MPRLLIGLIALALGLPFLLFLVVVASNPNVNPSIVGTILQGCVIVAFAVLFLFEVKRLADEP